MSDSSRQTTALVAALALVLLVPLSGWAEQDSSSLSDPTRPARLPVVAQPLDSDSPAPAPGLRLQAVFTGPKGDAALINGQLINPGQGVAGAVLQQVRSDGVLLERDGESWEMPLGVSSIKQPAGQNRRTSP